MQLRHGRSDSHGVVWSSAAGSGVGRVVVAVIDTSKSQVRDATTESKQCRTAQHQKLSSDGSSSQKSWRVFSFAAAHDLDERNIRESPEHDVEAGQDGLSLYSDSTKIVTSQSSSLDAQKAVGSRFEAAGGLSEDGFEQKPLTNLDPAHPHGVPR